MQVAGRTLVLATFAIGFAMAGGAWWYNYQQSRRTAEFWGRDAAALLVGSEKIELLELIDYPAEGADDVAANRAVLRAIDLTGKPGLVHFRHTLTYDANFEWDKRHEEGASVRKWDYALRFTKGDRQLVVVFERDFKLLAKVGERPLGDDLPYSLVTLDVLPCPRLGPVLLAYFKQIGVSLDPTAKPR